ncbi:hypothetical protein QBC46DRAFT_372018 [Diplogelasinospora grovesii]|uniref:Bromodomain associated domain-containing protein n=1 Tax=Diplogelasinospora grovesii TaxID=303347 RepID=A0AAN6NJW1_9PEZI|nr:hypothetical protein QBC46DRAFT_372018 [Diplogelasinospora grovesii]
MTPPPSLFHSLLRPAVLQILRAAGYHGAKTSVLDSLTDLAARYFFHLCQMTALYASLNGSTDEPTVVDVRMALQRVGALLPEKGENEQEHMGVEDMRGLEEFLSWIAGPVNKEIKRIALDSVEEGAHDYLTALKKKHSKTDDDSKYMGTFLGKPIEHGDVQVEGGEYPSIFNWEERLRAAAIKSPEPDEDVAMNGDDRDARSQSSGLSSLGDRDFGDDMDFA